MATLSDLVNAMFGVEGNNPNLAGNNNPGNLMYVGQAGATLGAGGFAAFQTLADGIQAAQNQIVLDLTRGTAGNGQPVNTLTQLIANGWSPANAPGNSQASTDNYISTVASATGIDPNAPLATQLSDFPKAKGHQLHLPLA
jgi:hypothetical protein